MLLQTIWFYIWGLLWAAFFMTDGFDLGIGTLYPFLARNDEDKRIMINSLGPLWDGNEVWLIAAGGITFAAFPLLYAVMFSAFYTLLMMILFALILRGVSFEFRGKLVAPGWRRLWDGAIFIGSVVPAVLFGVVFGNIFQGIPIDQNGIFQGNLMTLLNPYALLSGLLFLLLFMQHGALWLCIKTVAGLQDRCEKTARRLWPLVALALAVFLVCSKFATRLYDNYTARPALFLVIALTVAALLGIRLFLSRRAYFKAWFASAATIVGATFFGIIGLFPDMFPSSLSPDYALTAFNASSSPLTLKIMLIVAGLLVPVVIAYQSWAYHLFRGKVRAADLNYEEAY